MMGLKELRASLEAGAELEMGLYLTILVASFCLVVIRPVRRLDRS